MNPLLKIILSILFLGMIGGWIYAAILTLKPAENASKLCLLGYKAHCSFTPISTIICITIAIIIAIALLKIIIK